MWGAIIGDIAGSIYEYEQFTNVHKIDNVSDLIPSNGFYSDDTILTIGIIDAIINKGNYEEYLRAYAMKYLTYHPNCKPYFKAPFSPNFIKWVNGETEGKSSGNGAIMRISGIGYLFNNLEDVISNSIASTIPSHNSIDALNNAKLVSMIIFYSRKGLTKEEIINKLNIKLKYKEFKSFNYTCEETIDNCLYAVFTSNSFEESIKKVISYGADTDTNACIVGSIAEAMYGIDKSIIDKAKEKLPVEFINVLNKAYNIL